jgi:NAD(P)H-dependent FMN reductase
MNAKPKILAFAGSARENSYNKMLIHAAASAARAAGAEVTLADLRDFSMPIYDGDLEDQEGVPVHAIEFRRLMLTHQGLLIASPEYNSSISPLLKNTIDWVSRPVTGEENLSPFRNKVCALLAASPGRLGGLRGLIHVRAILGNLGGIVLPEQMALSEAHQAFNSDGGLRDAKQQTSLTALAANLVRVTSKLHQETPTT